MMPGECVGGKPEIACMDCGAILKLQVCNSGGGYYIGYWCNECGPYSRESQYFTVKEVAEAALKEWLETKDPKHMRWAQ